MEIVSRINWAHGFGLPRGQGRSRGCEGVCGERECWKVMVHMKTCSRCRRERSREEFYAHSKKPDRLQSECKSCKRETRAVYERSAVAKRRRRAAQAKWVNSHPEKAAAHQAVRRAKALGRLVSKPCEQCGDEQTEAHHDHGYEGENATCVTWLCKACHTREHMKAAV